jgi:hypothetical protein
VRNSRAVFEKWNVLVIWIIAIYIMIPIITKNLYIDQKQVSNLKNAMLSLQ